MPTSPLRRVVELISTGRRLMFRLDCGHAFAFDDLNNAPRVAFASHVHCATCAAVARESRTTPSPLRIQERRCARCGKPDLRPSYAPPPPACFHCRTRPFVELSEQNDT